MNNDRTFLARYGLKFNPFSPSIPIDAIWRSPDLDRFLHRVEGLVRQGGFAMISGEPGVGKSRALQLLASRIGKMADVMVGVMQRPQSKLGDFYREMGELFGLALSPANRYGGFKALRARWIEHFKKSLLRPVLFIDEAQEVPTNCLNEIRLLGSENFDSECLLTTVLCGDDRLPERFRSPALAPLGSRLRLRLNMRPLEVDEVFAFIEHSLQEAGAAHLMSKDLKRALAEHCGGNLRVVSGMANDLLTIARDRDLDCLDDKLFIEAFNFRMAPRPSAKGQARARG